MIRIVIALSITLLAFCAFGLVGMVALVMLGFCTLGFSVLDPE